MAATKARRGMTVLLAGAHSYLGRHLNKSMRRNGFKVRVLGTNVEGSGITFDSMKATGLPHFDVVINCSESSFLSYRAWTDTLKDEIYQDRVERMKLFGQLLSNAQEPPSVVINTIPAAGFYTASDKPHTENDSPANDWFGRMCKDAEDALFSAAGSKTRAVSARVAPVWGADGGVYDLIRPMFKMGIGAVFGRGEQYYPWIHVEDACRMYIHAINHDQIKGGFNVTAPALSTNKEFTEKLYSALGYSGTPWALPETALTATLGAERANLLLQSIKVQPKKAQDTGFDWMFPDIDSLCADLVASEHPYEAVSRMGTGSALSE